VADATVQGWFRRAARWRWVWVFAGIGIVADLDLLVGLHRTYTHSIGAAALVLVAASLATRRQGLRGIVLSAGIAASYLSHILLDWLGADHSAPPGIMALWPFSSASFISGIGLFSAISRKLWMLRAWKYDSLAVAREVIVLGPLALAAWHLRRPRPAPMAAAGSRAVPPAEPAGSQNSP
jgi:hypothetical protein